MQSSRDVNGALIGVPFCASSDLTSHSVIYRRTTIIFEEPRAPWTRLQIELANRLRVTPAMIRKGCPEQKHDHETSNRNQARSLLKAT